MNKKAIIPILLLCSLLLSGCSLSKYFYISVNNTVVLHEQSGAVLKEDVANGTYSDLMLPSYITDLTVTRTEVMETETRTLASAEGTDLTYYPACGATDTLGNWINASNCTFTFKTKKNNTENPNELFVASYTIQNFGSANTFGDYLSIMSALSQYYGECTIELYKEGSGVVSISDMQQAMENEEIINDLSQRFADGSLQLKSQWIDKAYDITVYFNSPSDCSVVYTLNI